MKLRSLHSFEELGTALPVPTSPAASALVSEARDLRAILDQMVQDARAARERAAAQAAAAGTLEAEAAAIEAILANVEGLVPFGVDAQVVAGLAGKVAGMRTLAQELRADPGVRAYTTIEAAEEAAREQAVAETRRRLRQALGAARDLLRQGDHEKASALISEIRAEASTGGLVAEFDGPTTELADIVARQQAAVKARQEAVAEAQRRKTFGQWLKAVRQAADFARGDVVVTLGLGQALHLRPTVSRRGTLVWTPLAHIGTEPKGPISSLPKTAKVWDWRQQAPTAAKTLAEAERRARAVAVPPAQSPEARPMTTAVVPAPAREPRQRPAAMLAARVAEEPAAYTAAAAPAPADIAPALAAEPDLDGAIVAALREAALTTPDSPVAAAIAEVLPEPPAAPAPAAEEPHLVVCEAEEPGLAIRWADAVAEILTGLGHEALGAQVDAGTPQIAARGLVIDTDEALEVEITVNGRILATPETFTARSAVKSQAARERNVRGSLARQMKVLAVAH